MSGARPAGRVRQGAVSTSAVVEELRERYADNELDYDRIPTEAGFVQWLAARALSGAAREGDRS